MGADDALAILAASTGDFDAHKAAILIAARDRILELEREARDARIMFFLAITKLGGELRLTRHDLTAVDQKATIERQDDPATGDTVYRAQIPDTP